MIRPPESIALPSESLGTCIGDCETAARWGGVGGFRCLRWVGTETSVMSPWTHILGLGWVALGGLGWNGKETRGVYLLECLLTGNVGGGVRGSYNGTTPVEGCDVKAIAMETYCGKRTFSFSSWTEYTVTMYPDRLSTMGKPPCGPNYPNYTLVPTDRQRW